MAVPDSSLVFDYIIVGSGTAGSTLANRLSADPSIRVLLLEAGGKDDWIWMKIPVGYLYCINNPRADWRFRTVNEPGLNGRSLLYPRGLGLGGSSSINAMIYMRGQKQDYDGWAKAAGDSGWDWDHVLPVFKGVEDYHRGANEWHGTGGEWHVAPQRLSWEILDAFQKAAAERGIPPVDDFNRGNNFGCGKFEVNQRRGVRLSASTAFLKPALGRPNLTVLTRAFARRVLFSERRATGIEFEHGGALRRAMLRTDGPTAELILASGAVGTPQLLQVSGVGPRALLSSFGIPVIHAAEQVGANLHDHLQLRLAFKVRGVRTLNEMTHSLLRKAGMALEYALYRTGPLTMAPSQLGAFVKSEPSRERPNLQFHVQPLSLDKFGDPLHTFPAFTASVCNLQPTSRGWLRITSPDLKVHPEIHPNYLSTDEDKRVAVAALRVARNIIAAPALQRYAPEEFVPGPQYQSDEDLVKAAGNVGTTIFHPVGTCRMGSDADAVVDSRLRVKGVAGLRVVDASIMPTITSGNTAAPTGMIALQGSRFILEDRRA
ncbi:MAG TPA: GMC family oxidoreductase N-terminal domain-containing protein [bacterium]